MEPNHYYQVKNYSQPLYTGYIAPQNDDSLDALLSSDSHVLLDQVINNAFSIVYRLKIHTDSSRSLDYSWSNVRTKMLALEDTPFGDMYNSQRTASLEKEIQNIESQRHEQKLSLWSDLKDVTNELITNFHQYQGHKLEQRLLR